MLVVGSTCQYVTGLLHAKAVPTGARGGWRNKGWGPKSSWRRSAEHDNALNCQRHGACFRALGIFWGFLGNLGSINISFCGWLAKDIISYRYRIPGIPFVFKNKSKWIQVEICNSFLRGFLQLSHDCGRSSRIQFDGNASCHWCQSSMVAHLVPVLRHGSPVGKIVQRLGGGLKHVSSRVCSFGWVETTNYVNLLLKSSKAICKWTKLLKKRTKRG